MNILNSINSTNIAYIMMNVVVLLIIWLLSIYINEIRERNKPLIIPLAQLVMILAVYALGYIAGNSVWKPAEETIYSPADGEGASETETESFYDDYYPAAGGAEASGNEAEFFYDDYYPAADGAEASGNGAEFFNDDYYPAAGGAEASGNEVEIFYNDYYYDDAETDENGNIKFTVKYNISYSELSGDEKTFYNKIIAKSMREDNTFITDKEISFSLNKNLSKSEMARVRAVLHNNYPGISLYATGSPNAWMQYVTHYINGLPVYQVYYFNIRYV